MKNQSILYGLTGLLIGVALTGLTAAFVGNNDHNDIVRMMNMYSNGQSSEMNSSNRSMDEMTGILNDKKGDAFDTAFIEQMIIHHQGAINMAKLAQANAKHDEVKSLANDIVTNQSKEIVTMQAWQKQWGYTATSSTDSRYMMDMRN